MMKYSRYSSGYYGTGGGRKINLWVVIICIAIALVLILLLKPFGIGGYSETDFVRKRDQLLRTEAKKALEYVNKLSETGGSSSYALLEMVRQHVHGIEVLNELNNTLLGKSLYSSSDFDAVYNLLSTYTTNLNTGQKVISNLSELREAVSALNDKTIQLLGDSSN